MCNGKTVEAEGCEFCPAGGFCDGCFYKHSEAREHRVECRCVLCVRWGRILTARIHEGRVLDAMRRAAVMFSGGSVAS